jgi:imidazoleglycerol-phosphate dehydratase
MLLTLATYSGVQLDVEAAGDLQHHVVEDVAITLGTVLRNDVPLHCARYGHAVVPMDEALVEVAIDIGGRAFYAGKLPSSLYDHFFRSLSDNAGFTTHVRVIRGTDRHHVIEAAFKALGLALRSALIQNSTVFSTKGSVVMEQGVS